MIKFTSILHILFPAVLSLLLLGCQGESTNNTDTASNDSQSISTYEGLVLYAKNLPVSSYKLKPMDDASFNALSSAEQKKVADKLLSTLYFGMPEEKMQEMLASQTFISTIEKQIQQSSNDLSAVEERLNDNGSEEEEFYFSTYPSGTAEVAKILARFYALKDLDKNYIDYWSAYILTSTIMFSPAYELDSSHAPNIDRVYSNLVRGFREDYTAGYITFVHMVSDDNWRRFRSPEDNGREMMEIFLQNFSDTFVPIAAKALQNWKLSSDNDTLVIGLDENTEPLELFGTTITDGFDFYRELVKSPEFIPEVSSRLVDIYFPSFSATQKAAVVSEIVASHPQTWQDILLQIVFSKTYLLESDKAKSAEELFFSLSKKTHFEHRRGFFSDFARALTQMNQASMKYKLGKYTEVPLDTQSFMVYHKYIRENLFIRDKRDWTWGWNAEKLIPDTLFENIPAYQHKEMLHKLINHLFLSTVAREADEEELKLFDEHMLNSETQTYIPAYKIFRDDGETYERVQASRIILDYLSRLSEVYQYQKVQ